jgi:hypothetical protein
MGLYWTRAPITGEGGWQKRFVKVYKCVLPSEMVLPDIITVYVPVVNGSDGETKQLVVEIENKAIVKPFLGGYLDKRTSEYIYISQKHSKNCRKQNRTAVEEKRRLE